VLLSTSCDYKPVHPSLWTIGNNKKEFKKVLDYYSKPEDSLKLRAAEFLIENMDNHFYYQSKNEDENDKFFQNIMKQISLPGLSKTDLYAALRRVTIDNVISKALNDGRLAKPEYRKRSDIKTKILNMPLKPGNFPGPKFILSMIFVDTFYHIVTVMKFRSRGVRLFISNLNGLLIQ
jgi:hypothetical protein